MWGRRSQSGVSSNRRKRRGGPGHTQSVAGQHSGCVGSRVLLLSSVSSAAATLMLRMPPTVIATNDEPLTDSGEDDDTFAVAIARGLRSDSLAGVPSIALPLHERERETEGTANNSVGPFRAIHCKHQKRSHNTRRRIRSFHRSYPVTALSLVQRATISVFVAFSQCASLFVVRSLLSFRRANFHALQTHRTARLQPHHPMTLHRLTTGRTVSITTGYVRCQQKRPTEISEDLCECQAIRRNSRKDPFRVGCKADERAIGCQSGG